MMPSVLVIDDERDVRDAICKVLSRVGFDVTTAADGLAGVSDYLRKPTDVVIVDIVMPHRNGVEVIRSIRARLPGARIVAITGGGNFGPLGYAPDSIVTDAYLAAARRSGADAVMAKPFHRTELISVVRSLVKN